ncbi:MAG: outer membrane beta-barrel protein [Candidatus Cryptobacteroides sp.]
MYFKRFLAVTAGLLLALFMASAQKGVKVSATLIDSSNDEPVGFATVSLQKLNSDKPYKYVLSTSEGKAVIEGVSSGKYVFKAEIMGYKLLSQEIEVKGDLNLGILKMDPDVQALEAAKVTATGNPIIIKKDTIEYNASSFKTTDTDMLEDLLKKLPGVEVSEDGTVTANGETISKITIDGKTFFLDDPQLASKNLPAKMIEKLKVVQKKSEQAEFTGIDDGNEETVIDLTVHKGMMNGAIGNISLGGGSDLPSSGSDPNFRYQGGAFVGKFTEKSQISFILNGNNTNNRGFNDISGGMMQGMRGGGMGGGQGGWGSGNGITESWMAGLNGAWTLFDGKMDLGGNYLYNRTDKTVEEESIKNTFLEDGSVLSYNNNGYSNTFSDGHRIGMRLEHKFSDNTSIVFQPQFDFGRGNYSQVSDFETYKSASASASQTALNDGFSSNVGDNKNWNARGFLLFRQRLGIPGRTISFMGNFNFSHNTLDGFNQSLTNTYDAVAGDSAESVNQRISQLSNGSSLSGRIVYTEPLGHGFYISANYSYSWNRNKSQKDTYNSGAYTNPLEYNYVGEALDATYTNSILNVFNNQSGGLDLQYQKDKLHAQAGIALSPTNTHNETNGKTYDSKVVNWAPSFMTWYDFNDNTNLRIFYRGQSSQPSTTQLMPVPDNSNPLNISLGNPSLKPYFNHSFRGEFRMSNKKNFSSLNFNVDGSFVQNPIVSTLWYGNNGVQYTMPVNGPGSGNIRYRMFFNSPIAKSDFSVSLMSNGGYSYSSSYVGKSSFDMSKYLDSEGVFSDYDAFISDYPDMSSSDMFTENMTRTVNLMGRIRLTYRNDFVELTAGARTRMNRSWYTLENANNLTTWNNQVNGSMNWTIPGGITFKTEANYNWYNGYSTPQEDEVVINIDIQKLLFKDKFTLSLRGYDILDQAKNLTVTDASNYHQEVRNNTLGRYVILALTYRFGSFGKGNTKMNMGAPGMGGQGPSGPPPRM